jgi:hypothetical protein
MAIVTYTVSKYKNKNRKNKMKTKYPFYSKTIIHMASKNMETLATTKTILKLAIGAIQRAIAKENFFVKFSKQEHGYAKETANVE